MLNSVTLVAFHDELEKIASHGVELLGLGTLAAPHAYNAATGKRVSHKTERNAELAGLGVLAAPSLAHYGKKALKAGTKLMKKADADLWEPGTGRVIGPGGTAAANRGVSTVGKAAPKKPQFTLSHLQKAYQSQGLKPGLKSVARLATKAASANLEKEAFIGKLLGGAAKAAPKAPLKMSFQGHANAIKKVAPGTKVDPRGVTNVKDFDPMRQAVKKQRFIEVPGLT
jgi:hypothetical protein